MEEYKAAAIAMGKSAVDKVTALPVAQYVQPLLAKVEEATGGKEVNGVPVGTAGVAFVALLLSLFVSYRIYKGLTKLGVLRTYVLGLALYELLPLSYYMVYEEPLSGFTVNLTDAPAERRLYCVFLGCVLLSRLNVVFAPPSISIYMHLAAVQVLEFVYLFQEQKVHAEKACPTTGAPADPMAILKGVVDTASCPGAGSKEILAATFANAIIFSALAFKALIITPGAPKAAPKAPPPPPGTPRKTETKKTK